MRGERTFVLGVNGRAVCARHLSLVLASITSILTMQGIHLNTKQGHLKKQRCSDIRQQQISCPYRVSLTGRRLSSTTSLEASARHNLAITTSNCEKERNAQNSVAPQHFTIV
jgi:hypothetical protein